MAQVARRQTRPELVAQLSIDVECLSVAFLCFFQLTPSPANLTQDVPGACYQSLISGGFGQRKSPVQIVQSFLAIPLDMDIGSEPEQWVRGCG